MSDDLNTMIQETSETPPTFNVDDLAIPATEEVAQEASEAVEESEEVINNTIPITTLGTWFAEYKDTITNVHQLQAQIRGVDPVQNLIVSVDDPNGEELEGGVSTLNDQINDMVSDVITSSNGKTGLSMAAQEQI